MKVIHKAYKFPLIPTKNQEILLNKHFGCTRFVYNYFLNQRKEQYQIDKISINYYDQANFLVKLKKENETIWLKDINSQTLQYSLRCLETSYLNFFRGKTKFPRFKSKKDKNSFTIPQFTKVENNRLYIPKFRNGIKINLHREIQGIIKHCTISKTPTGKYFVSIICDIEYEPITKTSKECGIDLGLKSFIVTSDNKVFKNNRYTKKYARKLAKSQKHLSRKQKGSNRYEKQRLKTALIHEKITNTRADNLHKISTQLIREYDFIAIEDLNIKGMIKNHKLAKSISDAAWGTFVQFLLYKADWNDKQIVKVGRFYPSSKTCSCGWINQDLELSDREWECKKCGKINDRDSNAARNILKEGKRIISAGTVDYTLGDSNKTSVKKHKSMKSEIDLVIN